MYQTLNTVSAVLFILSGTFAASAVYMFFHYDIREYRALLSNDAENRMRAKRKQLAEKADVRDAAPAGDMGGGTEMEKPRKTTVTNPEQDPEKKKKKPKFVMRTVSESDALRKEEQEKPASATDTRPVQEPVRHTEKDSVYLPDDEAEGKDTGASGDRPVKQADDEAYRDGKSRKGDAFRDGTDKEARDGITGLQDGSDDTAYLKDSDRKKLSVFEDDDPLWIPATKRFRTTGSSMIIHTDRTISQILSEKGR